MTYVVPRISKLAITIDIVGACLISLFGPLVKSLRPRVYRNDNAVRCRRVNERRSA
jgi:hypothetical protein